MTVHFPNKHISQNQERKSQLWGKWTWRRLDIYFGGGEMDWGRLVKVRGFGRILLREMNCHTGELDWGNSIQKWGK